MWKGVKKTKLLLTERVLPLLLLLDSCVAFAEGMHDSDDDDDDGAIFFSSLICCVKMEVVRDDPLLKSTNL